MKKNQLALLSMTAIIIAGCTDTQQPINIEDLTPQELSLVEQTFNKQVDETQYIQDLEDFLSYDISLETQNKPYLSQISLTADLDEKSSIQGGLEFSRKNILKSKDQESIDIVFNLEAEQKQKDSTPLLASGDVTLLYQNNEMYADLHNFGIFMGEGDLTAKMYTLLGAMIKDKWVDLEINSGGIITVDKEDTKLPYAASTLKNILETKEIQSSPDFLGSVAEMMDTINSYVDLGISTNELKLLSHEIEFSELSDEIVQKNFIGSFQGKESSFDLSFTASKNGLDIYIYNIKNYDEATQSYQNSNSEFLFSLAEEKKSNYSIIAQVIKDRQSIADIEGNIKYSDTLKVTANFILQPTELVSGQNFSGKLKGTIKKKNLKGNEKFPQLSGDIILVSDILSSL